MRSLRAAWLASLLWTSAALADELSVEKVAQVQAELEKARKQVSKKYGDKPSSELTNEERAQYIADERSAVSTVFEKLEVDPKAYGIRELRMPNDERAAVKAQKEALLAREAEAKKEAAEQPPPEPEVQIVRGTSDEEPLEVYRDEAAVEVERPNEDGIVEQPSEETSIIPEGEITR